ncbi:FAD/NAD(P)-binding domain-containing protein [Nemania abortiva]|nr:FAD/NAD(P)-binding domain-containing protein [Nemania abortiva]
MMSEDQLRVIIVGAGPIGLYMAHALQRAGVGFIVLEQRDAILNTAGQVLFVWPQTVRLFDQLGLLQPLGEVAMRLHSKRRICGNTGRVLTSSEFWNHMYENHGYPFLPILRYDLVRIMYEHLQDHKSLVMKEAQVVGVESSASGAKVTLKNGTVVHGTIVIGADGVHSRTRALMQLARGQSTSSNEKRTMTPNYRGIFGRASNSELNIEPGVLFESRGAGSVIQCLSTKDDVRFVTITPQPLETSSTQEQYSLEDKDKYVATIADVKVLPSVTFADIWKDADRSAAVLVEQEEGFLDVWYHHRIVLVGDAVHKTTSVNGLGLNCGMHSAAALANQLHGLHERPASDISIIALQEAFGKYQNAREAECRTIWQQGCNAARDMTTVSRVNWFWDNYVLPWVDIEGFAKGILVSLLLIRHGQILNLIRFDDKSGKIAWLNKHGR